MPERCIGPYRSEEAVPRLAGRPVGVFEGLDFFCERVNPDGFVPVPGFVVDAACDVGDASFAQSVGKFLGDRLGEKPCFAGSRTIQKRAIFGDDLLEELVLRNDL